MAINIFISYSHCDKKVLQKLLKTLAILKDEYGIKFWYDNEICVGEHLWHEIYKYIDLSDIYILIFSPDYLSSKSCKREMEYIYSKIQSKSKVIIPIIARECAWQDTKISNVKVLPEDGKAITNYSNSDTAYLNIYHGIKQVINKFHVTLKESYINEINKTDLEFNKLKVKLSDIYTPPKLSRLNINEKIKTIQLDSEFFKGKNKYLFIVGDVLSGKTSILYNLIINANQYNIFPIYIDANCYSKTLQHEKVILNAINEQYECSIENYLRKSNKTALVDNYNEKINIKLLKYLQDTFDHIIFTTTDEKYNSYFINDNNYISFNMYHIQSFNNKNTYTLLDKISKLRNDKGELAIDFNVEVMENQIKDVILDRKVVPTYPSYILLMVNVFSKIGDIQISSYGDCYLALLLSNLSGKGIERKDINDSAMNYLVYIAYNIFCKFEQTFQISLTYTEYNKLKEKYIQEYSISNNILNRIENSDYRIINFTETKVSFQHQYLYYFLAAKGIISFNNETTILHIIKNLMNSIETIHSSYILLFITHHYKQPSLLDVFKDYIKHLLVEEKPFLCTSTETDFLKNLMHILPSTIRDNRTSVSENKIRLREEEDSILEYQENISNEERDNIVSKLDIEQALQSIRVAGQIVKNWAGTYKKDIIYEFLKEIENLSFRVLNKLLHSLKDDETIEMLLSLSNNYAKNSNKKNFTKDNIAPLINIFSLMFILSMIGFLYQSISTDKIIDIQKSITRDMESPALELLVLLLILSYDSDTLDVEYIIKLNKKFYKSNNMFAYKTLSLIIQKFIDTHDLNYKDKQKLIEEFKLMSSENYANRNLKIFYKDNK